MTFRVAQFSSVLDSKYWCRKCKHCFDIAWAMACPQCGSTDYWRRDRSDLPEIPPNISKAWP